MQRYAIYAYDVMFGGLHGMCSHMVVECDDLVDANDLAREESLYIIQSYSDIYEILDEEIREGTEGITDEGEIEDYCNDVYNDDIEYQIWLIDENIASKIATTELDDMFSNDPDDFIQRYCLEIE